MDPILATTRADLYAYAATKGRHVLAPHLTLVANELARIANGEQRFVVISMPPRHGKTEQVSRWGMAWLLGRAPWLRVMLASYEATFAATHGQEARDRLAQTSEWWAVVHGEPLTIDPTRNARNDWRVAGYPDGGMVTAGIGGAFTGKGANVLVIDDPVKNQAEAYSAVIRESHWQWWQTTARTRLEPGGSAFVVMTRWHDDDIAGRLLADDPDLWTEIRIPAVCDDPQSDPLGRAEGEALWPARYPVRSLAAIEKAVGSVAWQALYQGRPTAAGGDVFLRDWWRTYHHLPNKGRPDAAYASWDMTFKAKDTSDYVVGQVWHRYGARFYLVDQVRGRMTFTEARAAVEALDDAHPVDAHLVEDAANGPAIIDSLREVVPGLVAVTPDGSKEARARAVAPLVEAGNVYVPAPDRQQWVASFIDECASFPRGTNDDQVDAMSQALRRLHRGAPQIATAPR